MNQLNDLITLWKNQPEPESQDLQERIERARTEARKLARKVWIRDLSEIGAGVTTAAFFLGVGLFVGGGVLVGAGVAALCLAFVTGFLIRTRVQQARENRQPRPTIRKALELERKAVQRQRWLLRNVALWYLAPTGLAIAAFIAGVEASSPASNYSFLIFYAIIVGLLFLVIRHWNLSTARRELDPRIRELDQLLQELEEDED
jgi:hypothetical protein